LHAVDFRVLVRATFSNDAFGFATVAPYLCTNERDRNVINCAAIDAFDDFAATRGFISQPQHRSSHYDARVVRLPLLQFDFSMECRKGPIAMRTGRMRACPAQAKNPRRKYVMEKSENS
jgi:hypothetical protein